MADLFKPPHKFGLHRSQSESYPNMKRKRKANDLSAKRRRRTAEDFLSFCKTILDYENYDQIRTQDLRIRHSSSPLGSTGSSNESWPLSKEEVETLYNSHNDEAQPSPNMSTDDEDDKDGFINDDEGLDSVTCYCGKPFAGRPMVECSKCLTWVHLKCAGLRRTNIPETWHCAKCKKNPEFKSDNHGKGNSSNEEANAAPVSGSRKRKSTKVARKKGGHDFQTVPSKTIEQPKS